MSKRYFKIDTGRYGGEVVVGTVSKEFVEYWRERDQDDMLRHVLGIDWEDHGVDEDEESDVDRNSPDMTEDGNVSWHEVDDFEHVTGAYSDNDFLVYEIELAPGVTYENGELVLPEEWEYGTHPYEEITEYEQHSYCQTLYGREAYTHDPDGEDDYVPIMQFHSAEKGCFGEVFIETDGSDFDPEKLAIGIVETDLCEVIEAIWYDGVEQVINYDWCDTVGKGMYGCVGYMNEAWYDKPGDYTPDSENVKEALECIYG